MAEKQKRADVQIFGKTYTLVSEHSPDYAMEIAEEVDGRMVEISEQGSISDTTKIAMMAAMQIADELMKARKAGRDRLGATETAKTRLETAIGQAGGRDKCEG